MVRSAFDDFYARTGKDAAAAAPGGSSDASGLHQAGFVDGAEPGNGYASIMFLQLAVLYLLVMVMVM